jgi:hypothetical protein
MHAMYEIILQGYGWTEGWKILQKFARNVRNFSSGASQIGKEVAVGEIVYGIAIDTYASDIIRQVGRERLGFTLPKDFAALNGDGISALKGAPNFATASAFIEFLLSKEGQLLWYTKKGSPTGPVHAELGKLTILPSLYGTVEPAGLVTGNPFTLPNVIAYNTRLAGDRWNLVNDLFGIFLIDQHHTLRRVSDLSTLTGIPISEAESIALAAQGTWGQDSKQRTEMLREWSQLAQSMFSIEPTFRERYQAVPGAVFALALLVAVLRKVRDRLTRSL